MGNYRFLRVCLIIIAVLVICAIFLSGSISQAQIFPTSYYYTNPLYYSGYGYFNSINGYLLGYAPFTPFITNVSGASAVMIAF